MSDRKIIYADDAIDLLEELETKRLQGDVGLLYAPMIKGLKALPPAQPEPQWIPCGEPPSDNREVEVTCETKRYDGKKYRYTCHASYVHRYSIESTDYCNWEECDEYNAAEDKYYALAGWYERVHNWDDYSYCAIEDSVIAWRELTEPYAERREE